jgi:hypothetical protein
VIDHTPRVPNGLTPKQEAVFEELNTPPPGTRAESLDHRAIYQQLRESPPVPPVPAVVLTADRPPLPLTKEALAKKFPGAEHITDTDSTHYIQLYNPQLVTDSIRRVVEAERDGEKTVGDVKGAD